MRTMVLMQGLQASQLERVRALAPDWRIVHGKDKEQWLSGLHDAEVIAGWNSTAAAECIREGAKLRWVQNWGAGVDQMPLAAFAERGIVLTNASGVHAYPISETILGMMLALTRKLHTSIRDQANRTWGNSGTLGEIHGKTAGIIGVGAIGEETARIAKAFGMQVLGVRRSGEPLPFVDRMVGMDGLDVVLAESDFVINTLPLTDETRHCFNRDRFSRMKRTACYINIGRGGTTDTEALMDALKDGTIACAGLDVFEQEPLPSEHPLWELENVIMTPHNAGSTKLYNERAFEIFITNLQDYIEGRTPSVNVVDLKKQY